MSDFAVIFDMNGVIINDTKHQSLAWKEFAARHGFHLSDDDVNRHIMGTSNRNILTYLFKKPPTDEEFQRYTHEKETAFIDVFTPHLQALTGLTDFLDTLKGAGIPLAVGTSAPPIIVDFVMDGLNLRPYFEFIVDDTQVTHHKPHPEVYLTAAARLGYAPENCVGFEDTLTGTQALRRAGMKIIGVMTSRSAEDFSDNTDLVIHDFTEMNLDILKSL